MSQQNTYNFSRHISLTRWVSRLSKKSRPHEFFITPYRFEICLYRNLKKKPSITACAYCLKILDDINVNSSRASIAFLIKNLNNVFPSETRQHHNIHFIKLNFFKINIVITLKTSSHVNNRTSLKH